MLGLLLDLVFILEWLTKLQTTGFFVLSSQTDIFYSETQLEGLSGLWVQVNIFDLRANGMVPRLSTWEVGLKNQGRLKFRTDYPGNFVFDYKNPSDLNRFITEGSKIVPSRLSKLSYKQQRQLSLAVKRARNLGLLPSGIAAYSRFNRSRLISPKPFEV